MEKIKEIKDTYIINQGTTSEPEYYVRRHLDVRSYLRLIKSAGLLNDIAVRHILSLGLYVSSEFVKDNNIDTIKGAATRLYKRILRRLKNNLKEYLKNKQAFKEEVIKFAKRFPYIRITMNDAIEAGCFEKCTERFVKKYFGEEIFKRGYVTINELLDIYEEHWNPIEPVLRHIMNKYN